MAQDSDQMKYLTPPEPILTVHLYPIIEEHLIELLGSLAPEEWESQTIVPNWTIKDIAAHLLDTELRRLSGGRDGYVSIKPDIRSNADLVKFINGMNSDGVAMYRRLSPRVLTSLMELVSKEAAEYLQSLDPFAWASFGVSWAGEEKSLNWFDIAREYTERWHHQQQIRLAVSRPGIMTPELYYPVLDCFMRALPFTYRDVQASSGSLLQVRVSGDCGGDWFLVRDNDRWQLSATAAGDLIAKVTIPQEIAWRVFTKGIDRSSAERQSIVEGEADIGNYIFSMISIVG